MGVLNSCFQNSSESSGRPHDGTKMIKCVNCSEWFHPNCLCVVGGHIPPEFFFGEFCMRPNKINMSVSGYMNF